MKWFCVLVVLFSCRLLSQDNELQLLSEAKALEKKGDFITAAKLYNIIYSQISDSSLKAESLYRYIACGDGAARVLTGKYYKLEGEFHKLPDNHPLKTPKTFQKNFDSLFSQVVENYSKIGIKLKFVKVFDYSWVNIAVLERNLLSDKFSTTAHGELVSYEFITEELDSEGFPTFNDPHIVIERADSFLKRYPNSKYKYDVFHIKGLAFQDLWNFSEEEYKDNLTDAEKQHPEKLIANGIKFLSLAKSNKNKLQFLKWDPSSESIIESLKAKKYTGVMHYYGD